VEGCAVMDLLVENRSDHQRRWRMKSLIAWMVAVLMLGSFTLAMGQSMKPMKREAVIESCDKNQDGRIDRQEYFVRMTDVFFFADRDKNGYLDMKEILVAVPDAAPERVKSADADRNGKLDLNELRNALSKDFEREDRNGDGVLDRDEVQHMVSQK
jgi:Ca2+-binding EF-hand superfamily protein